MNDERVSLQSTILRIIDYLFNYFQAETFPPPLSLPIVFFEVGFVFHFSK